MAAPKPPPSQSRPTSLADEVLVRRTKALSIADTGNRSPSASSMAPSCCMSTASSVGSNDLEMLQRMVDRLDTVLDITEARKGTYRSPLPRGVSSHHGPRKWVSRYVDYTSKYGLGFLLSDGSSGVYFNDSTKIALESHSDNFQYIERKKFDEAELCVRRVQLSVESFSLSQYPDNLKKKVTLLKHFRNYLLEQHQEEVESLEANRDEPSSAPLNLVYVKKWLRTKHAILFRLSNQTVQIVFYDQSEILLTPDDRYVTYVDKARNRTTYDFTDELVGSSPEIEKRLRYTKDVISQLLSGRR